MCVGLKTWFWYWVSSYLKLKSKWHVVAKGYLRANPSSEDSRSVCRSRANKNAPLCTFRCVAWQKARLTGNLDRGGVFLRPRVNLGQRQRSRGRSVSGLNFTTNRGTFKMYNSPRDHWSNRYFETLALQRSSAEFKRCNTSIRVCMSLCVCVCISVRQHWHSGQLM